METSMIVIRLVYKNRCERIYGELYNPNIMSLLKIIHNIINYPGKTE